MIIKLDKSSQNKIKMVWLQKIKSKHYHRILHDSRILVIFAFDCNNKKLN